MQRLLYVSVPVLVEVNEAFDSDELARKTADFVYGTALPVLSAEVLYEDLQFAASAHDHHSDYNNACQHCIDMANDERNAK